MAAKRLRLGRKMTGSRFKSFTLGRQKLNPGANQTSGRRDIEGCLVAGLRIFTSHLFNTCRHFEIGFSVLSRDQILWDFGYVKQDLIPGRKPLTKLLLQFCPRLTYFDWTSSSSSFHSLDAADSRQANWQSTLDLQFFESRR